MGYARFAAAVAAAFVVSQIAAVAVHGFVLAADYEPFRGSLLRADAAWQMLLLPVAHLCFVIALVFVYPRLQLSGSLAVRGLKLGALGWLIGQVPLWLLWYAEQPWPGALVVKQLVLELVSTALIGLTIAAVARPPLTAAR
jgi:hypothetical protein